MTKIFAFLRHNSCMFLSVIACSLAVLYIYSCQSTVVSLVNSPVRISRAQLVLEVDAFLSQAELLFDDLDRQDLVKDTIFNSVLDLASGKAPNPIGIALTLAGILGIGAVGDNIRKRTYINTLKGDFANGKVKEKIKEILKPKQN